jgi:DNA-binding response OmpR family regulator
MQTGPRTVLLVEDDRGMRLLCRVNLELEGYRVLEAPTIDDARDFLASGEVDLVVLDVHVAGESGLDLIETIRERDAPIALMTGSAQLGSDDRDRVDAVLPKPFAPEELMTIIDQLSGATAEH